VWKPEGRIIIRRPMRRGLGEKEWEVVDWIHLAQETIYWRATVNKLMNLRVP
jgi:hypothetical protein